MEQTTTSTHAQCVRENQSGGCVELSAHLKCEEVIQLVSELVNRFLSRDEFGHGFTQNVALPQKYFSFTPGFSPVKR